MVSSRYEKHINEITEELESVNGSQSATSLNTSSFQRVLLDERKHSSIHPDTVKDRLPRFVKFESSSNLSSKSSKFQRIADEGQNTSSSIRSLPKQDSIRRSFSPLVKKINWSSLWKMSKQWIRDPMNMALFVWILCVAISGAILFLVMTGMLNGAIPEKSQRDDWFEINNQILNALFTLMALYQHPKRIHHLILLCRWQAEDILKLRKVYCKNGTEKPNERKHLAVVIGLLHLNCFAQYALCGLNIGYSRPHRPAIGVGLCISAAIGAPAVASVYNMLSPLGSKYSNDTDEELAQSPLDNKNSSMSTFDRSPVSSPQWEGGLFDFWDDVSLAYLSVFCSCCVFGWNLERLGFGNMYVHVATFLLFCLAPFFIFNLAAVNIDSETIRAALSVSGVVLCVFGLLYGGFWRIRIRKKFNLPANGFCCGKPAVTDCFQWLCCCSCSLAQEVRTADYYDVVDDKLYAKQTDSVNGRGLSPLPREDGSGSFGSSSSLFFTMQQFSPNQAPDVPRYNNDLPAGREVSFMGSTSDNMRAPLRPVIERENNTMLM